jgi:hypothetical protein
MKQQRVWRNHYICDECPNEFSDEMLVISHSWCPCCDAQIEPYSSESLLDMIITDEDELEDV